MSLNLTPLAIERFKIGYILLLISAIILLVGWLFLGLLAEVISLALYIISAYFIRKAYIELNDLETGINCKSYLLAFRLFS